MKSSYKDCNNQVIHYGDILRYKNGEHIRKIYSVEPFFVLCKHEGKVKMYVSGIAEYVDILDCKLKNDKINELNAFEIFVPRNVYQEVISE